MSFNGSNLPLQGSMEDCYRRLAAFEQEHEQAQTALEDVQAENERLAQENRTLTQRQAHLAAENDRLRHLLAQCHARLLEVQAGVARGKGGLPQSGLEGETSVLREELQVSVEELQVTAEELEAANGELRHLNENLEQVVRDRTAALTRALKEREELVRRKDLLVREVDHRVKNSLQMVVSLLRIQARRLHDEAAHEALKLAIGRVEAVAKVHGMLYAGGAVERVGFDSFLQDICGSLARSLGADGRYRTLIVETESVELPSDMAIPLALAVNELVTNAFRHAFDDSKPGTVWVQFHRETDGTSTLRIADDGRGLPEEDTAGLGMQVISTMAEGIGARLEIGRGAGACFTFRIPMP